jgi:hypothetical protein
MKQLTSAALWIVPETGHMAHEGNNKQQFLRIAGQFLSKE